jgi:uncharacterized membrane protein
MQNRFSIHYLKTRLTALKPEFFFLVCASVFGLLTLIITPPFQSPDELNHFYRVGQISEGHIAAVKENNRIGGYVPASFVRITEPFLRLRWNIHAKTSSEEIRKVFEVPLNDSAKVFVDFPNTGMYSPVCYLPQVIVIAVLKYVGPGPLSLFYAARFAGLLAWILGMFIAIRMLPFFRWAFVLLALLPMSVFVHTSLSADTVTNVLSFLTLAYILKLIYISEKISLKSYALLCLLTILLASAKLVYTPLILLAVLIPKQKFGSRKAYFFSVGFLFAVALFVSFGWSRYMNSMYLPYEHYNPMYRDETALIKGSNIYEQMHYILDHGSYIIEVMLKSLHDSFTMYFEGYIGVFGWLDSKLPLWFIWLAYGVIFFCLVIGGKQTVQVSKTQRIIFVGSLLILCILILLSQHLTWDRVGADVIGTIQGRYFIPVFPLLALLFYNRRFSVPSLSAFVVICFSLIALLFMIQILYERYYSVSVFDSTQIHCGAEKISVNNMFVTDHRSVLLDNVDARTDERARTGHYSVKLNAKRAFGFTYRANDLHHKDVISVSAWRYGNTGSLVIANTDNFFITESKAFEKDSAGWEHIFLKVLLEKEPEVDEIGIFIYNTSSDSSYFDDIEITLDRLK